MHWLGAFVLCVLTNWCVIPLWWLFLETVNHWFLRIGWYRRIFYRRLEAARRRVHGHVEAYGYLGLALFVAIPLPVTGAYTGLLAAWSLGMERRKSWLSVALGVAVAGAVVTLAMTGVLKGFDLFVKNVG
jgi:uncharacterized membrane protein